MASLQSLLLGICLLVLGSQCAPLLPGSNTAGRGLNLLYWSPFPTATMIDQAIMMPVFNLAFNQTVIDCQSEFAIPFGCSAQCDPSQTYTADTTTVSTLSQIEDTVKSSLDISGSYI